MKLQVVLKLKPEADRPIVNIPDFHNIDAMIDTGSVFPVWCAGERTLKLYGGEKNLDFVPFGGF